MESRNSLAVLWLGLGSFTAGVQVQSLVRELRSHKPYGVAKKINNKKKKWKVIALVSFQISPGRGAH